VFHGAVLELNVVPDEVQVEERAEVHVKEQAEEEAEVQRRSKRKCK
jgi:hypothetical protein